MDIQLPHVSGLDLIRQMKTDPALRPVPTMAVTAYAGKGDEEQIRAAGAADYVSNRISVIKFHERVGSFACGGRRPIPPPRTTRSRCGQGLGRASPPPLIPPSSPMI